jgi:endonuclease/exonuclease/phosphatase family metal-dependent hydrolase
VIRTAPDRYFRRIWQSVRAVRLMTYNVNYGNREPRPCLDAIAAADCDVVLLQEVTARWQAALADRFAALYPVHVYRLHGRNAGGLAVLSKLPVGGEELFDPPEGGWFPAQRLVVTTSFGDVQILHVHLRPALDAGSWFKGFVTTPPVRQREIETYWPRLVHALPTVIAGDFNEDPTGLALDVLGRHGYARVATTGPRTWHYEEDLDGVPWDVLKLDIDHVMVGPTLVGIDGEVLDAGTSDHRPVIATIAPV